MGGALAFDFFGCCTYGVNGLTSNSLLARSLKAWIKGIVTHTGRSTAPLARMRAARAAAGGRACLPVAAFVAAVAVVVARVVELAAAQCTR